jgi:hypothetical protein
MMPVAGAAAAVACAGRDRVVHGARTLVVIGSLGARDRCPDQQLAAEQPARPTTGAAWSHVARSE